jgi:hypothetical protein
MSGFMKKMLESGYDLACLFLYYCIKYALFHKITPLYDFLIGSLAGKRAMEFRIFKTAT